MQDVKGREKSLNTDELNPLLYDWGHSVTIQVVDGQFFFATILTLWDMWFRLVSFWKSKQGLQTVKRRGGR